MRNYYVNFKTKENQPIVDFPRFQSPLKVLWPLILLLLQTTMGLESTTDIPVQIFDCISECKKMKI